MKGGYKIIDFKNVSLSGTPVTMTDVLVDLLNNYDKVVLLSHVVLSGSAKDDCFSTVLSDGAGGVKLNCYDGYISINSSGAVTYTVASASGMAGDIAELQGNLADTNNMIAPAWSATETYTKNAIVRDDGSLYKAKSDVPKGTATSNTTYWENTDEANEFKSLITKTMVTVNSYDALEALYNILPNNICVSAYINPTIMNDGFGINNSANGTIAKSSSRIFIFVATSGAESYICRGGYDPANHVWTIRHRDQMAPYTPEP